MYQNEFIITQKISNNAFHYEERSNPHITVPSLRDGSIEDVKVGKKVVFEDFDYEGRLCSCIGLEHFIKTSIAGVPTYIFDNHNHAFYFWNLEFQRKTFQKGARLVHVDQHKDNRQPPAFLSAEDAQDLEKVFTYTNTDLNVGNFIPAGEHLGLIKEIVFINSDPSLDEFHQKQALEKGISNTILDLDLDFFAPDFDYIDNSFKIKVMQEIIPKVKLITIATSPFFIDQELALAYLRKIASLKGV